MAREEWEAFAFKSTLRHRLSGPEVPLHCETNLLRGSNVDNLAFKRDVTVKILQEEGTLSTKTAIHSGPKVDLLVWLSCTQKLGNISYSVLHCRSRDFLVRANEMKWSSFWHPKHNDYQLIDTLLAASCQPCLWRSANDLGTQKHPSTNYIISYHFISI
jgi:hypothetical protein